MQRGGACISRLRAYHLCKTGWGLAEVQLGHAQAYSLACIFNELSLTARGCGVHIHTHQAVSQTTRTTTTTRCPSSNAFPLFCVTENKTQAGDMADVDRSTGAAKRRRERRLRSWWRHEWMSVAAALVEATHHSFPKGGWSVTHNAPRGPKTASAREEPTSFRLFDEEDVGGMRPDRLHGIRPENRDHQHTVEHIIVLSIDVLVLHTVEQLAG